MSLYQETEPQIVSRLSDTLKAIRTIIGGALTAAQVQDPIEVLIGYPTWTEATRVLAQPVDPGFVTVDALPDVRIVTRYRPEWMQIGAITTAFSAAFTSNTVTISSTGQTPIAGTNIHSFFAVPGGTNYDASYETLASDNPNTVATAIATAIDNLAVPGVSAAATTNAVTLTGAAFYACNVGGSAPAHKEVARVQRTVQVSIWVSSPWARFQCHDAITTTLGAIDNCWLTLPDGGRVLVLPKGENFNDQSQSSYNVYIAHLLYHVEYGVVQTATAAQICAIDLTQILQNEKNQLLASNTYIIS